MLVELKNSALPSKSDFEATVAAGEFMSSQFKGRLAWSRMVISSWSAVHIPRHTVPIGEAQARRVAVHCCSMCCPRLGVGSAAQQHLGLRPSEMLALTKHTLSLPEHRAGTECTRILALGQKTGTRAKREQSVILRDERVIDWLRWVLSLAQPGGRLLPHSYDPYGKLLKRAEAALGLSVG